MSTIKLKATSITIAAVFKTEAGNTATHTDLIELDQFTDIARALAFFRFDFPKLIEDMALPGDLILEEHEARGLVKIYGRTAIFEYEKHVASPFKLYKFFINRKGKDGWSSSPLNSSTLEKAEEIAQKWEKEANEQGD